MSARPSHPGLPALPVRHRPSDTGRVQVQGRILTDGIEAVVRGALDAGCDFFAGYPITPASQILMAMMRDLPRHGGVAVQGEDEIASMGMCIGAAMAGRRVMTATSGPGMSLYSEQIGLAVMGEVPMVIVDVQRLGPATGGATTVGQGDVQFARWGTSGGYPMIVLAPWSVPSTYRLTMEAFDLAERFRTPVILLTDKELALTSTTVDSLVDVPVAVRSRAVDTGDTPPYRVEASDDVPPMRPYGLGPAVRFTGSTHDEDAMITKDPGVIHSLNSHLRDKVEQHRDEIERVHTDLDPGSKVLLVSYGVSAAACLEAARQARSGGDAVSVAVVESLWPVPESALGEALAGVDTVLVAELNHGQYRKEIESLASGRRVIGVHRVDGRQITPDQILEAAR